MVAVAGVVALVVYEVVGLRILRTAWVNLDRIWAYALVGAGVATIAAAVTS
jgi:sulfite exporter TauE/SafE